LYQVSIGETPSSPEEGVGILMECNAGELGNFIAAVYTIDGTIFSIKLVSEGDHMKGSVTYSSTTHLFTLTISDSTHPLSFSKQISDSKNDRSESDWSLTRSSYDQLADFGKLKTSGDKATISGRTTSIGAFATSAKFFVGLVDMNGHGCCPAPIIATANPISSTGTSFSITWNSAGP
jgi:hypothetical protein